MTDGTSSGVKSGKGKIHFIGAGGIGMSALAQFAVSLGFSVTGSDRGYGKTENEQIFDVLSKCGVTMFPQDGSACSAVKPDFLVYSTAIEKDNPDLLSAPADAKLLHRSVALSMLVGFLRNRSTVAVAGTCGKTTVTGWLSDALYRLDADPGALAGGIINAFGSNFRCGSGDFVIEADESDKSLLNYTTDSSLILNIGTDHYSKEELSQVFSQVASKVKDGLVIGLEAGEQISDCAEINGKERIYFSLDKSSPAVFRRAPVIRLDSFRCGRDGAYCSFDNVREMRLPSPGRHTAANAMAVYAYLRMRGFSSGDAVDAVEQFAGVWRRFDRAGKMACGAEVYDDYAHNPDKVASCIEGAFELEPEKVFGIFQPHGFAPLKFMREELFSTLEKILRKDDVFIFLPVYYAGGTASFTPTSEEVAKDFASRSAAKGRYLYFSDRSEAENYLKNRVSCRDKVLVMGARDNSLSLWAKKIARDA